MSSNSIFIKNLKKIGIEFFTGVPDSVLKNLTDEIPKNENHIITANEGSSIALAAGYYLSKKRLGCVYFQNSGLGNAINPLASITHKKVYSIPLLLLIGWRGYPRSNDEPQHLVKGLITKNILKLLNIKYLIMNKKTKFSQINKIISYSKKKKIPVALIFKKTFPDKIRDKKINNYKVSRSDALLEILKNIKKNTKIISSTGYNSREILKIREKNNINLGKDFYLVGGMGHTSMVALGSSIFDRKNILCLDGDGSMLMHFGNLFTAAQYSKKNFKYILLNNGAHESVGGQTTNSFKMNLKKISYGLGFKEYQIIKDLDILKKNIGKIINKKKSIFLEIKISNQNMKELPRPKNLKSIKHNFMS